MDRAGTAGGPAGGVRRRTIAVAALVTTLAAGATFFGTAHATASPPQIAGSVAAPTAAEVSPICTTSDPAAVLGPATTNLPSNPVSTLVTPSGGVAGFSATSSDLYVDTGTHLITYTLAGAQVSSFSLPSTFGAGDEVSEPVVDSSGDIYLSSYYGTAIDKFSPSGTLLWSVDPQKGNPTGLFAVGSGANFELVTSLVQDSSSLVLSTSTGATSGTFPIVDQLGDYVTQEAGGNLLLSGNGYVETVSPTGQVLSTFGAPNTLGNNERTGSGSQFYYPAQAVQGPDGTIYTADPLHTMEATSPNGFLQGSTTLNNSLSFGGWGFALENGNFYFQSGQPFNDGSDAISTFSLASVTTFLGARQAPSDTLGWGAGITTPNTANYFAPGTTPSVVATFDPWWTSVASSLQLSYSIESVASLDSETVPAATVLDLPTTATGLASIPLTIPSADTAPGPYEVQATLLDTATSPATTLGTTCLPYAVGAPGDNLDFATLPAGIGSGGPTDPRGVALNAQLGLRRLPHRLAGQLELVAAQLQRRGPDGGHLRPVGHDLRVGLHRPVPGGLRSRPGPRRVLAAGQRRRGRHLAGPGVERSVGGDIAALVAHYATVPAGCGACAPVTVWEPWNESNNTGWSNGATYATQVLKPFYQAVKSVEPGTTSIVLGGSTLEPVPWLVAAADRSRGPGLDGRRRHPPLHRLQRLLRGGRHARPGRAAPGAARRQAAVVHRGRLVERRRLQLSSARPTTWPGRSSGRRCSGCPVENYFYDEGAWGNDGVSFSLIQTPTPTTT